MPYMKTGIPNCRQKIRQTVCIQRTACLRAILCAMSVGHHRAARDVLGFHIIVRAILRPLVRLLNPRLLLLLRQTIPLSLARPVPSRNVLVGLRVDVREMFLDGLAVLPTPDPLAREAIAEAELVFVLRVVLRAMVDIPSIDFLAARTVRSSKS